MKTLLTAGLALWVAPLLAQTPEPPRPATGHSSENTWHVAAYGTAGRVPGYYRYAAAGLGLARRNRWRYPDAEYDSDVTLGVRLGAGQQQAVTGSAATTHPIWGVNPYAAVDGRFFGAALGVWVGRLGDYRAEGQQSGRVVPQLRARAGQVTGWHGVLSYADEFGGLGNPFLRLGGAYGGWLAGRLRVGGGLAVTTLAPPEQEIGVYLEAGLRRSFGEGGLHVQLPLGPDGAGQAGVHLVLGGSK
ncbi:hypothetical protein [Hymenobacter glacieicola]|uniref:Outer membrane protein beta-barrel domain-containing protein n=1 Tax=Hymenobacter glacieicola TaxID=1562124 RepID=A0ABQ1WJK7_9BACT|nr:hypothetical protein [Hymenobacter glacieicola]GGG32683.1 hypothetical protein GCM10011378_06370 [Hymenobacter glacieicola]